MSTHKAITEEVVPVDCLYGECEHDDADDCPPSQMLVCDTCREPWEGDADYELFVGWPCAASGSGEGDR